MARPVGILGRVPAVRGLGFAWKQTGLGALTDIPFSQDDWPIYTPIAYRDYTWIQSNYALLTAIPPDLSNVPLPFDWGTPEGSPPLNSSFITFTSLALNASLGVPFRQRDWPLPTTPRYPIQTWILGSPIQLSPSLNVPFNQDDWPIPQPQAQPSRSFTSFISLALNTIVILPNNQDDWPLPLGHFVLFNSSLRTLALSPFPPPTAPVDTTNMLLPFDWGTPEGADYTSTLRTWLQGVPPPPGFKPFKQDIWPLTPGPQQPERNYGASYNLNLIGQDKFPTGDQISDLPPRDYDRAIQLRTWIQTVNLALITPPQRPFNTYDWPINTGPQQPIQIFTATFPKTLIGQDKLPFRQQDWPTPTPPARQPDLRTWIVRTTAYLQRPFVQTDWPNPRAARQPALSFTASYNPNLIGKDRLPFRQMDWPVPTPKKYEAGLRTYIYNLQLRPPAALPFNQYQWPLPRSKFDNRERTITARSQFLRGEPVVPPLPNVERPWIRDYWDRDEWGNFLPGSGIRRG